MKSESPGRKDIVELDRVIHEPGRLTIMAHLAAVDSADSVFLQKYTGLTWGNLSSHMTKLEEAGYLEVIKEFVGKKPHTMLRLTKEGRLAFDEYRGQLERVLQGGQESQRRKPR